MRRVVYASPIECVVTALVIFASFGAAGYGIATAVVFVTRAVAAALRHASWPDVAGVSFLIVFAVALVFSAVSDLREV